MHIVVLYCRGRQCDNTMRQSRDDGLLEPPYSCLCEVTFPGTDLASCFPCMPWQGRTWPNYGGYNCLTSLLRHWQWITKSPPPPTHTHISSIFCSYYFQEILICVHIFLLRKASWLPLHKQCDYCLYLRTATWMCEKVPNASLCESSVTGSLKTHRQKTDSKRKC